MNLQQLERGNEIKKELKALIDKEEQAKKAVKQEIESFRITTTSFNVASDGVSMDIYKQTLKIALNMVIIDLQKQIKKLETEFYNL